MSAIILDSWLDIGVNLNHNSGNQKVICPACSESRKNKKDKCLSVSQSKGVANCHNCGQTYLIRKEQEMRPNYTLPDTKHLPISDNVKAFFKSRGIEERTLEYFKITTSKEWMYEKGEAKEGLTECINFNYYDGQELTNIKFRASNKRFKLTSGARLIMYNLNAIKGLTDAIINEGEIDTMSAYQCNVFNCVSVPNGASKGNQKLEYLDNCYEHFVDKEKIIIAVDNDEAGNALKEELIRRFGREKCYTIEYPEGCKDTNEVLLKYGAAAVKEMYLNAKQLPLVGIYGEDEIRSGIMDIYHNGYPKTCKVGYSEFDNQLSFRPGELTTVTGIPSHGKSNFIDQIMVRLAARHGWRAGVFSPENQPSTIHVSQLIPIFIGMPIVGSNRAPMNKIEKGIKFVNDHFFFMKVDEIDISIDGILQLAKELVLRKGINMLVIDPYNCLEHKVPKGYSETQYISEFLTKLINFLKQHNVHGFLIAHPTKMQKDKNTSTYNVPTLYDIAGSSNFYNKTYNGITIHRDFTTNDVTVHVQKIKYKWVGKVGNSTFTYDAPSYRYAQYGEPYENELERIIKEPNQLPAFEDKEEREPGRLTDMYKLVINGQEVLSETPF